MSGLEQLSDCLALVLAKLEGIETALRVPETENADRSVRAPVQSEQAGSLSHVDMTRPLTAVELCERWSITAESEDLRLHYLARLCRQRGLCALRGRRGWHALYARADVLRAEEFAAGKVRGRKVKSGRATR